MDNTKAVMADTKLELTKSLNKRHSFNVTNGASKFNDANFRFLSIFSDWNLGYIFNPVLNGICDMWHH